MRHKIIFVIALFVTSISPAVGGEDVWTPRPQFSIEGSNYIETLTFIAGVSYALGYSDSRLKSNNLRNFYCLPNNMTADSKVLFDLLNQKLNGDYTSEQVMETLIASLEEAYPCD